VNERAHTRLDRLADRLFLATVAQSGLPHDEGDTRVLAAECYAAALIVLHEGRQLSAALGAQRGLS
jgi:hypothetical protein